MNKTKGNFFVIIFIAIILSILIFCLDDININNKQNLNKEIKNTALNNLINYTADTIHMTDKYLLGKDKFTNVQNNKNSNDDKFIQELLAEEIELKKNIAIGANKIVSINDYINSMNNRTKHLNEVLESNLKNNNNKKLLYNTNGQLTRNDNSL